MAASRRMVRIALFYHGRSTAGTRYKGKAMTPDPARQISFDGLHCTLRIEPHLNDVVVLRIAGTDIGEFGEAPMTRLSEYLAGKDPVRLFIDAREVRGASIEVSGE